jgi:hypothetical protein
MSLPKNVSFAVRDMATERPLALRVCGDCMEPLLASGTFIYVARNRFYWPGDVLVVIAADGGLIAHRLIGYYFRARRLRWLTQADAAIRPDASIVSDQVIGRVCGGDCSPVVVRIPLRHRGRAVLNFVRFAFSRLTDRDQ